MSESQVLGSWNTADSCYSQELSIKIPSECLKSQTGASPTQKCSNPSTVSLSPDRASLWLTRSSVNCVEAEQPFTKQEGHIQMNCFFRTLHSYTAVELQVTEITEDKVAGKESYWVLFSNVYPPPDLFFHNKEISHPCEAFLLAT